MTDPLLDREHLALYTGGDAALEAELFSLFTDQLRRCLSAMEQENGFAEAAHTLKGAARGIGAKALGEACAAAEARPGQDSIETVRRVSAATLAEIEKASA